MKKIFLLLLIISFNYAFSQSRESYYKMPDSITAFGTNLTKGQIVLDQSNNKLWKLVAPAGTLNNITNTTKFLLNAGGSATDTNSLSNRINKKRNYLDTLTYDATKYFVNQSIKAIQHNNLVGLNTGNYHHLTTAEYTIATTQSDLTHSGYLSSLDWNTFNQKYDGNLHNASIPYSNGSRTLQETINLSWNNGNQSFFVGGGIGINQTAFPSVGRNFVLKGFPTQDNKLVIQAATGKDNSIEFENSDASSQSTIYSRLNSMSLLNPTNINFGINGGDKLDITNSLVSINTNLDAYNTFQLWSLDGHRSTSFVMDDSSTSVTYHFPHVSPSNNFILQTDASGNLTWVSKPTGTLSGSSNFTNGRVPFTTGISQLSDDASFTWDNSSKSLLVGKGFGIGNNPSTNYQFFMGGFTGYATQMALKASSGQGNKINFFGSLNEDYGTIAGTLGSNQINHPTSIILGIAGDNTFTLNSTNTSILTPLSIYGNLTQYSTPTNVRSTTMSTSESGVNMTYIYPLLAPTTGQILSSTNTGQLSWVSQSSSTPAGSSSQVQFNNSGNFGANTNFSWNTSTNDQLTIKSKLNLTATTSGNVIITPSSTTTSYTLTLPSSPGTSGQSLVTDGTGTTSWTTISGGGGSSTYTFNFSLSGQANSTIGQLTKASDAGSTGNPSGKPTTNNGDQGFNNGGSDPYIAPATITISKATLIIAAAAVGTGTFTSPATARFDVYKIGYSTRTLITTFYLNVTNAGVSNNLGGNNFGTYTATGLSIPVTAGDLFGVEFVNENGNSKINALSRIALLLSN